MTLEKSGYLLDTNVFLHNPECMYAFPGEVVFIPLSVIEELDHFKSKISEIGRNSRITLKNLEEIRLKGSLMEGIKLENGSTLYTVAFTHRNVQLPDYLDLSKNPNRILSAALHLKEREKPNGRKIILVTNDYSLKIRAGAFDLDVIGFNDDKIDADALYDAIPELMLDESDYELLNKNQALHMGEDPRYKAFYANMHLVVTCDKQPPVLCRYIARNNIIRVVDQFKKGVWEVFPKNAEQAASFDVLTDPGIDIVVLAGKAGTGKTMLALAAALDQLYRQEAYTRILVCRPIVPMGRELGHLPGDLDDKIAPWMQPIFDNLEFLHGRAGAKIGKFGDYRQLIQKNLLEIEALSYIRGRSIPNRFMIVDEAQNLTPHEIKTIVTRAGEGTKVVLTGDPYQIDNPYLDSASNGLTYIIEKLRDVDLAAHVYLKKGERSRLAELASNLL